MVDKYQRMINTFRIEMDRITKFFKRQQASAPVPRNYPDTSGRIYWVRSLLYHLKHFIDHFEEEENLKQMPEYRKLVKQYNDTGVMLMRYEINVQVGLKRKPFFSFSRKAKISENLLTFREKFSFS
jgi:Dynein heavy chain, N-terminal region 1